MTTEVQEREIDFETALKSSDEIYKEQVAAGMADPPDKAAADQALLEADVAARRAAADELRKQQGAKQAQPGPGTPPQAPEPEKTPEQVEAEVKEEAVEKTPQQILADLGIKSDPKTWTIGPEGAEETYIQRPLTFISKIQFFSYIGEVLDKAMTGQDALHIGSLFEIPTVRTDNLSANDFRDAETFIQAIGKLLRYAPDFLEKCYCIWLGVPDYQREWAIAAMKLPPEEGGLTDDDGIEIIEVFIDQNWDQLQDFFGSKIKKLGDRLSARYRATRSEQSKPSNLGAAPTPTQ